MTKGAKQPKTTSDTQQPRRNRACIGAAAQRGARRRRRGAPGRQPAFHENGADRDREDAAASGQDGYVVDHVYVPDVGRRKAGGRRRAGSYNQRAILLTLQPPCFKRSPQPCCSKGVSRCAGRVVRADFAEKRDSKHVILLGDRTWPSLEERVGFLDKQKNKVAAGTDMNTGASQSQKVRSIPLENRKSASRQKVR